MPVSDLDIARTAHLWIQRHGAAATAKACEMVEKMRREGDEAGADTWLRIIVAIGELGIRVSDESEADTMRACFMPSAPVNTFATIPGDRRHDECSSVHIRHPFLANSGARQ